MSTILQSDIWAQLQEANGHQVFRGKGEGWQYMATLEGGSTGRYLYAPTGPKPTTPPLSTQPSQI